MQPDSRPRLFFIDNLRIGLIALVVAHHAGQAYGPTGGWWYFMEPARAGILGAFFDVNRSFFMSLFFMISGYFCRDVERCEPRCVGLGDDQRRVFGGHDHAVGKSDIIGHLPGRPIGSDHGVGKGGAIEKSKSLPQLG